MTGIALYTSAFARPLRILQTIGPAVAAVLIIGLLLLVTRVLRS